MNEHENMKALSEKEEEAVSGGTFMASKPGIHNSSLSKSPISLGEGLPADSFSEKPRDGGATGGW